MSQKKAPASTSRAPHALVVDDHEDSAQVIAMMLKSLGYETETANDGVSALSKANTFHPRFIFLDINMPKLDGFDACSVIRAQPWAGKVRLIAVTGLPEETVMSQSSKAGFDAYILKPVEFSDLKRVTAVAP